jgi:hypothetical protein
MLKMLTLCASVLAFASGLALAETTLSTGEWLASDVKDWLVLNRTKDELLIYQLNR